MKRPMKIFMVAFFLASFFELSYAIPPDFSKVLEHTKAATVFMKPYSGGRGSGFCIQSDGYFVTNKHVAKDCKFADMVLYAGTPQERIVKAAVVRSDLKLDLTLLRAESPGPYSSLSLASEAEVVVGTQVLAVGFPYPPGASPNRKHLPVQEGDGKIVQLSVEQQGVRRSEFELPLRPGHSGGPIINEAGHVVAVVVSEIPRKSLTYGIPVADLKKFLEAPDIEFKAPLLQEKQRQKKANFKCRVRFPDGRVPEDMSVELVLNPYVKDSRRKLKMKPLGENFYGVSTRPEPALGGPGSRKLVYTVIVREKDEILGRVRGEILFAAPDEGLLAYWPFDEAGPIVRDMSGRGLEGMLQGGVRNVPGVKKLALAFDGQSGFFEVSRDMGPWLVQTGSLSFWLKLKAHQPALAFKRDASAPPQRQGSWRKTPMQKWTKALQGIRSQPVFGAGFHSATPLEDNSWHHIVLTHDSFSHLLSWHQDGELRFQSQIDLPVKVSPFFWVGKFLDSRGRVGHLMAELDELRIYSRVLNQPEIQLLGQKSEVSELGKESK